MDISIQAYKDILIARYIDCGCYRDVYWCGVDTTLVVKIEKYEAYFQNVKEWAIWKEVENTPLAKWFAPCTHISNDGKILLQKKVELGRKKDYPEKIPSFFNDVKTDNFGFIGNQLVCFDYGLIKISKNFSDKKLVKISW